MFENHLKHLVDKHWKLNKDIDLMERSGNFGDANINEMKKERLRLKDEIQRIKKEHNIE
jgi:uncharacterized protein YdcH (DUF465 family)